MSLARDVLPTCRGAPPEVLCLCQDFQRIIAAYLIQNTLKSMSQCPTCQETVSQVRAGKNRSGSQRYVCKACGEKYTLLPNPNGYPEDLAGKTFRSIARELGVNHQTVVNWVNDYVTKSARALYKKPTI
jgi:transposase-like protein